MVIYLSLLGILGIASSSLLVGYSQGKKAGIAVLKLWALVFLIMVLVIKYGSILGGL